MFRSSQPFESQFRWEVDRWVFRFRQRGTPVEVTASERERLIARHIQRTAAITRAWFGGIFAAAFVVTLALRSKAAAPYVMGAYFGSAVLLRFLLGYWADQAVTLHLRSRQPVGEKLGAFGAWMMRAEVVPWPQLLVGCLVVMPAGYMALVLPGEFSQAERWASAAVVVLVGVLLAFMVVLKLLVDWRERRRNAWREALDDARDLRVD